MWIVRKADGVGKVYVSPLALIRRDYLLPQDFVDRSLARRFTDRNEAVKLIFKANNAPIPSLVTELDELVIRRIVPKMPDAEGLACEIIDALGLDLGPDGITSVGRVKAELSAFVATAEEGDPDFAALVASEKERRVKRLAELLTRYRRSFAGVQGPAGSQGPMGPRGPVGPTLYETMEGLP